MIIVSDEQIEPPPIGGEQPGGGYEKPPPNPRLHNNYVLTGVDGTSWDLVSGPVQLTGGVIGLGDAEVEHQWRDSLGVDGSSWRTMRHVRRTVTLPVTIVASTSIEFAELDAAFSNALAPETGEYVTLTVTAPNAEWRRIRMRRDTTFDEGYEYDPLLDMQTDYTIRFVADDPFWRGPLMSRTFSAVSDAEFFSPPGSSSVVNIAAQSTTAGAAMRNPGHVAAWPKYTISGPVAGFTAGIGDSLIEYGAVGAGSVIYIDTDPLRRTIVNAAGQDVWDNVIERKFGAIPRGARVPVNVGMNTPGAGAAITVEITPGYRRAW